MVFAIERYGYEVDRKKTSANSLCLKSSQDKILVSRDAQSGNYVYASLFNDSDRGSIIDFVQNRTRQSLGHIRKELRAYQQGITVLGYQAKPRQQQQRQHTVTATVPTKAPFDRQAVKRAIVKEGIRTALSNNYLTKERYITDSTLSLPRFKGSIFTDRRGNAIFFHQDKQGVCGYEKRNVHFKHFSKGGKRALWSSKCFKSDTKLVITESPIDSLALAQMSGMADRIRFIATSGSLSSETKDLLVRAAHRIRQLGGTVVAALDNDEAGKKMTKELVDLIQPELIAVPQGKDWADDLASFHASQSRFEYQEDEQSM